MPCGLHTAGRPTLPEAHPGRVPRDMLRPAGAPTLLLETALNDTWGLIAVAPFPLCANTRRVRSVHLPDLVSQLRC